MIQIVTIQEDTKKGLFQELLEQITDDIQQRLMQTKTTLLDTITDIEQEKNYKDYPHPQNTKRCNKNNNNCHSPQIS